VNQVVSHRIAKKQQMRWGDAGARCLAQVRVADLNGELSVQRIAALARCRRRTRRTPAGPHDSMIRPPTVWFTLIGIEVMSPRDLHPTSEGRSVRAATLVRWTLETAGGQAQGAASGRALRSIQRHRGVTLRQGNPEGRQPGADRPFVGENRPAPLGHRTSHQRMSASRLRTGTGVELQSTWRRPSAFQRPEIASLA
jgi:hypothetical protein